MHSLESLRAIRDMEAALGHSHACGACRSTFLLWGGDNCPTCGSYAVYPLHPIRAPSHEPKLVVGYMGWFGEEFRNVRWPVVCQVVIDEETGQKAYCYPPRQE